MTRRCTQREFLLAPSETTNHIVQYVLAVAASRFDISLHVFCVMSNHLHLVVTDPHANLPRFMQYFGSVVARAMNAHRGRWESFWAPDTYSAVRLESPADIVNEAAYTLANPVAAGLVRKGSMWPGAWSDPERIGGAAIELERPKHFFKEKGPLPRRVELALVPPPGFASSDEFVRLVNAALAVRERDAAQEFGGKFKGVEYVLKQKWRSRPTTIEPRRELNPRVAARDKWKRIEALARRAAFLRGYREARDAWLAGKVVVFPAGTYQLRVTYGVACAGTG